MSDNRESQQHNDLTQNLESPPRRKVVKTLVAGVGTLAAYNSFPTSWSKPIIEQIFLPAVGAASGFGLIDPCEIGVVISAATTTVPVSGSIDQPIAGLTVTISGVDNIGSAIATPVTTTTNSSGVFSGTLEFNGPVLSATITTSVPPAPPVTCGFNNQGG